MVENAGYYFLSEKGRRELPRYEYKGGDRSLLYKHVLSPLALFLVNRCTPRTVAPNTITLLGLAFMVVSYAIFWYYCPLLNPSDVELPSWIFLLNCFAMLIYQTMDNMDGKQARRTDSSSPLGLLFDHGCDSVNCMFGSANWIVALGLDPTKDAWIYWALVFGPIAMMEWSTWEEYYTGALFLPIVNGPSEGLLGGALFSLATAFLGTGYWSTTSMFDSLQTVLPSALLELLPAEGVRNVDILMVGWTFGFLQDLFLKSLFISRKYGMATLLNLLPFAALLGCTFLIGVVDSTIWSRMPRTSLHLSSALFVEMITQLMLDHVTHETHKPFFRWVLMAPMVVLTLLVTCGGWNEASTLTDTYLLIYASVAWTFLTFKMVVVVHELCSVLNIWCFDIVNKRPTKPPTQAMNGKAKHQ